MGAELQITREIRHERGLGGWGRSQGIGQGRGEIQGAIRPEKVGRLGAAPEIQRYRGSLLWAARSRPM